MNIDDLAAVQYGDNEGFQRFLFENATEHLLFRNTLEQQYGVLIPAYPIADADPEDVDDWLLAHQQEHQAFSAALGLDNPINLLDTDWRKEGDFYDWLNTHYLLHVQIINALGL